MLSGLFFQGNERQLLYASLRDEVDLVIAEDTVEEIFDVVEKTFREHADLPSALGLVEAILGKGELVKREEYATETEKWKRVLRDPSDAPLVACALAAKAEGIVTGDKDLLESLPIPGLEILGTRNVLARL